MKNFLKTISIIFICQILISCSNGSNPSNSSDNLGTSQLFMGASNNGALSYSLDGINWYDQELALTNTSASSNPENFNDIICNANLDICIAVGDYGLIKYNNTSQFTDWKTLKEEERPTLNNILSIEYGNGKFIATGTNGTIIRSYNGISWQLIKSGTKENLEEVIFDKNKNTFTIAGDAGLILTSNDGEVWNLVQTDTRYNFNHVISYNGVFTAVGNHGIIMNSKDEINWKELSSGTTNNLHDVIYGNGRYVAVGDSRTVTTSNDGIKWTDQTLPLVNIDGVEASYNITQILFNDQNLTAYAYIPSLDLTIVLTSVDGLTWSFIQQLSINKLEPVGYVKFAKGIIKSIKNIIAIIKHGRKIYKAVKNIVIEIDRCVKKSNKCIFKKR